MKFKKIIVLLLLTVLSSCRSVVAPEFDLEPIVKEVRSKKISYVDIKKDSELVVRVVVKDKLMLDNSVVKNKESFHSLRNVQVMEVLENKIEDREIKVDDHLVIKEMAAIDLENVYYTSNHLPLEEDYEYILFLKQNENEQFEILYGDNGVINIYNIINNQNIEITVNTIFEYFNPIINDIAIKYSPLKEVSQPKSVKFERYTIKSNQISIPARLGRDVSTKKEYLMLGNLYFEFEEPVLNELKK